MLKPDLLSLYHDCKVHVLEAKQRSPKEFFDDVMTESEDLVVLKILDSPSILLIEDYASKEVAAICGYTPAWQEWAERETYCPLVPFRYYETPNGFIEIRWRTFMCSKEDEMLLEELAREGVTYHYEQLRTGEWSVTAERVSHDDVIFMSIQQNLEIKTFINEFLKEERNNGIIKQGREDLN